MRTARALTVSPSMLCAGGGGTWSRGVYLVPGGGLCVPGPGSVPGPGGVPGPRGGGLPGPGGVPVQVLPLSPCEQNHTHL